MKIRWNKKFRLKNVFISGLCVAFCVFVLGGCKSIQKEETQEKLEDVTVTEIDQEQEVQESQEVPEAGFLFADVTNLEFYFASGAGAWCTELYIHEDGTFEGLYHDSDMGDSGEEYPNGTIYYCNFSGKFTRPEKVDDHTYSVQLEYMEYANVEGDVEIADGIRYIYSDAYGLENTEEFLLYLPGIALEKLPKEYLSWVDYYNLENTTDTTLPFYGIYNVTQGYGFSSYEYEENAETVTIIDVEEELANIETQAAALQERLYSNELTQIELNQTLEWEKQINFN